MAKQAASISESTRREMELERMKAAARAWYRRGRGHGGGRRAGRTDHHVKEVGVGDKPHGRSMRSRPIWVCRPSRYKLEAALKNHDPDSPPPPPAVPCNHDYLDDMFSYIDLDIGEETASKKSDFNGSASCNQYSRSSRSSSSKRVSFKAEDEIIFAETKNIIRLAACTNDFNSSLFDSYEIKSLSNYVLSGNYDALSFDGRRHSVHGDDDVSKKWWKEFSFPYDDCFPGAAMKGSSGGRGSKRHLWLNFMPSLCSNSSAQVVFSAMRPRAG